eukprot:scaffold57175_cov35-Tisochrysis_lutea.AAC.2
MFENQNADRISDFELKLMDIDSEHLGIPDTDYKCTVQMPSAEFQRICRDLAILGDTVTISVTKEGVKFSVSGEMGSGNMTIKPNETVDTKDEDRVKVRPCECPIAPLRSSRPSSLARVISRPERRSHTPLAPGASGVLWTQLTRAA